MSNDSLIKEDMKLLKEFEDLVKKRKWTKAMEILDEDFVAFWDQFDLEIYKEGFIEILKERARTFNVQRLDSMVEYDRWDWSSSIVEFSKVSLQGEPWAYLTSRFLVQEEQIKTFSEQIAFCKTDDENLKKWITEEAFD